MSAAATVKKPISSLQKTLSGYEVSELSPSQVKALLSGTNDRIAEKEGDAPASASTKGQVNPTKERLLTPAEASNLLGVSRETLRQWRKTGYGPPMSDHEGRNIRYPEGPLKAWIRCHTLFPEKLSESAEETSETVPQVA